MFTPIERSSERSIDETIDRLGLKPGVVEKNKKDRVHFANYNPKFPEKRGAEEAEARRRGIEKAMKVKDRIMD